MGEKQIDCARALPAAPPRAPRLEVAPVAEGAARARVPQLHRRGIGRGIGRVIIRRTPGRIFFRVLLVRLVAALAAVLDLLPADAPVRGRLEDVGVEQGRIRVEGYADTVPLPEESLDGLSDAERLARHRRVVVRIY